MCKNTLDDFINYYLERGFGSMNKNDFEVFIFNQLIQSNFLGKNNYEVSIELKIPESKVKRLRYESQLKYSDYNEDKYKDLFIKLIQKAKLKGDGKIVMFIIEDISLRKYLDSLLKKDGRFSDSSFNSEIVSVHTDDFIYLLENFYSDEEKEKIINNINTKKTETNNKLSFQDILKKIIENAASKFGEKIIDLSFRGIISIISNNF